MDYKKLPKYESNYSPSKLFDKISKVAKKAGIKTVYAAMILYYALMDDKVPMKDKAIVVGALGYFILPFDLIPDFLLPIGYGDDAAALIYAVKIVWDNITPEVKNQAKNKLKEWFTSINESDLTLF